MLLHYTNVNVTQRGIGRGTACDLLGYGSGGSDDQVRFAFLGVRWLTLVGFAWICSKLPLWYPVV